MPITYTTDDEWENNRQKWVGCGNNSRKHKEETSGKKKNNLEENNNAEILRLKTPQ